MQQESENTQKKSIWYPLVLAVLSFVGVIDSAYLSYTRFTDTEIVCGAIQGLSGCNVVAASPFSELFGIIPLAYLGLFFYLVILVLSILLFVDQKNIKKRALLVLTGLGFLSSVYFLYLQAFVIFAFCIYCVISAAISTLLFGIAIVWYFTSKIEEQAPEIDEQNQEETI